MGLDLATVGDKSPFELSGGQQRRVAFAGVLAMEPEVLVLDEPMAGLDPAARRDFLELIGHLHDEGLTVVMVSHSMDDLANCCDRIVVMNEGTVFAEGTPAQVFAYADELKSIGLGVPAAQRMALALAKAGVPLRFDGSIRLSRWQTNWWTCLSVARTVLLTSRTLLNPRRSRERRAANGGVFRLAATIPAIVQFIAWTREPSCSWALCF